MITSILLFIFLTAGTFFDLRKRSVPLILYILFGIAGIPLCLLFKDPAALWDQLLGLLPGLVFIGISLISDGKLGMGDSLAILITGIYLGGSGSAFAVLTAMFITSVFSVILLVSKKGSKKTELPFMPFLLSGFIIQQIGARI